MNATTPNEARDRLPFEQHHAFIIGIDAYEKVSPLQTAVGDARRLAEVLRVQQHFLVHPPLLNANGSDIRTLLECTLPEQVKQNDRVFFYFAGHGIANDGDDGPAGYLVPADYDPEDVKTLIPMADLQKALEALPCRHLLLVLDCCFSGAFKWSSQYRAIGTLMPKKIYQERFDRFIRDPAWQVITSAAYNQEALDVVQSKATGGHGIAKSADGMLHSPFARALFTGLEGAADAKGDGDIEGDGVITAAELYVYIRNQVEPETLKEGQQRRQTPGFFPLKKHDKGEFIFLHPRHRLNLPPIPTHSPYKGLEAFNEDDQLLFYGRDRVIEELRTKAKTNKLLVVSGASGTGKSSVVKAGLLPVLRAEHFRILKVIRPGAHPLAELEQALAEKNHAPAPDGAPTQPADAQKSILLIDQYEELITRCADPNERQQFAARLRQLLDEDANIHRIILTIRADFEPQLNSGALREYWMAGRYTVPPFSLEELREVIVLPAIQEVFIFDPPTLVDEIIGEVVQSPGALPLLSYALSELYEAYRASASQDRALKKGDYNNLGGVMGTLRTKADALYRNLTEPEQAMMRKIMLRMVSVEGDLAGKRVPMDDLVYSEAEKPLVDKVVQKLDEARLIVKGQDHIEPAHDALVRAWKDLYKWVLDAGRDKLILGTKLTDAATAWKNVKTKDKDHPKGILDRADPILDWVDRFLLRFENFVTKIPAQLARPLRRVQNQQGQSKEKSVQFLWGASPYLDVLVEQCNSKNNWFNQIETEFLEKSVLQKRKKNSWQWRIAEAVTLIISIAAFIAFMQWINAQKQLASTIGALTNNSQELFEPNKGRAEFDALLASLNAGKNFKQLAFGATPDLQMRIQDTLQNPVLWVKEQNRLEGHRTSVNSVSFSPNRLLLASASSDNTIGIWDVATGKKIQTLTGHKATVNSVNFNPDGKTLASASSDKTIKIWDVATGNEIYNLTGHGKGVNSVSFAPDGKTLASGSEDESIIFWDVANGKMIGDPLTGHALAVTSVSFSPDGKTVASGSLDHKVMLWDVVTHKGREFANKKMIDSVSFSPDGKTLAYAGEDQKITLQDVATGQEIRTFSGHSGRIKSVSFSHNGQILASTGWDNTIKLWDVATSKEIDTLPGHRQFVNSVSFSSDDQFLASASEDHTIKIWNIHIRPEVKPLIAHDDEVWSISFSLDGKLLASADTLGYIHLSDVTTGKITNTLKVDNRVRSVSFSPKERNILASASWDYKINLWNVDTGKIEKTLKTYGWLTTSISFSPSGNLIAEGNWDNNIKLWDIAKGTMIRTLTGHKDHINPNSVSFSPDGRLLASGSEDKSIILWDVAKGTMIRTLTGHTSGVKSVSFNPDGQRLASGSADGNIMLWDVAKGTMIKTLKGHSGTVNSVNFSPDGRLLASGGADKNVILWDVATRKIIMTLKRHTDEVVSVSFSPDDNGLLASGSADKRVILWNYRKILSKFTLEDLLARGCDWVHGYLQTNLNVSDRHLCE